MKLAVCPTEKQRLEEKVEDLMSERDAMQLKVEAMLDAITVVVPDVAEAVSEVNLMIGSKEKDGYSCSIDQSRNL